MTRRVFIFDPERCFGCLGCVAACANVNRTGARVQWRHVHKLIPAPSTQDTTYLSLACNHCANAPCVRACPAEALSRRESDGIVLHNDQRCLGCRYCQMACPYDAIKWDEQKKVVCKCGFCADRLDKGEEPACVATCFAGALTQIAVESEAEISSYAKEMPGFLHVEDALPSIRFVAGADKKKKEGE